MQIQTIIRLLVAGGAGAVLSGCASPGPPRPPSLWIARPVTKLAAERRGDNVHLEWTVPERTTDGLLLASRHGHGWVLTGEICRANSIPGPCVAVTHLPVHPGEAVQAEDVLPASLRSGAPSRIAYRVRTLYAGGKVSADSPEAVTVAGTGPDPVRGLAVRAVRQGAEIRWQPSNTVFAGDAVQLERTEPGLSQAQTSEKKKKGPTVKLSGSSSNGIVQLRIAASPDPGGATDQTAKAGAQYRYAVARVRQVMLNGHEYMLRGEASEVTSAILVDTFAPHVPVGLATVATPGPENNKGAIDLSWEPGTEVDAIGYNVYRSENGEPAVKITAQPIPGTSFHDEHVLAGRRYIYSITAIDRTGNESARSKPAEETMP